jgi:membrane protease YdiL (CAAX protease family)
MMNRLSSLVKRYPTIVFFVLAFILTWGVGRVADTVYAATQSIIMMLPLALLSAGPLVAALIVSALIGGKAEVLALLRKLTIWRVSWRWYVIALFLLPALHLVAIYLNVFLGAPMPTMAAFGPWTGILSAFAIRLVNPWDGPMLEELGWRGFALPRLQDRYVPLTANLILGFVVVLWHLPLIPSGDYAWIYIPGTLAVTILLGWVYNGTGGSVLLTLIMHASEPLLQVDFAGADGTRYMGLLVLVYVAAAVIIVMLAGKELGRKEAFAAAADRQPLAESA